MEKEKDEEFGIWFYSFVIAFIILASVGIFLAVNQGINWDKRYITVEGKIINTHPIVDENGQINVLSITFDNGKTYKVLFTEKYGILDLTVNSKLILELRGTYTRDWFWDELKPYNDIYHIEKIVKIP